MSIKSFFHNLFGVDKTNKQDAEKRVDDMVGGSYGYFGPPTPLSHEECKKCGGFFKPGSLKTITEINVVVGAKRGPTTHTIFSSFCDRCEPPSDVRFAHDFIGLGFDVLDDEYPDRGLRLGVANTVELTITVEVAKELLQRLIDEVEFSV